MRRWDVFWNEDPKDKRCADLGEALFSVSSDCNKGELFSTAISYIPRHGRKKELEEVPTGKTKKCEGKRATLEGK